MEYLIVWILLSVVVGVGANTRGRNGFGWFLLSLVISPLLAGLFLLASPQQKHNPLAEIAMLAAVEATPQNSAARKLLAEERERPVREAKNRRGLAIFLVIFFFVVYAIAYVIASISGGSTPSSNQINTAVPAHVSPTVLPPKLN
jgi:hypothetical protein